MHRVAGAQQIVVDFTRSEEKEPAPQPAGASTPAGAPDSPPAAKPSDGGPRKVIAWSAVGVGAAAAIGAVVTGALSLSGKGAIDDGCDDSRCPRDEWKSEFETVERLSLTTDILIGVAAAGVITGVILLVVKPKPDGERSAAFGAAPVDGGAALTITGRF